MQGIFETIFDIAYLFTVIFFGFIMITRSNKRSVPWLFGIMAIILGVGDAFHLVPRSYGLLTIGLEANATALGIGKLITSITMTFFYLFLYYIWRKRYEVKGKKYLSVIILVLGMARIILCLFPQNQWLSTDSPLTWGIYRNIPFVLIGLIMIILFFNSARTHQDKIFSNMWLAITLSFAFYIPVVLFASAVPMVGMLMIPKTLAYVWIVTMGYKTLKA
jgi:glucan phosphoethanolaminetransferase (alkaline phosphatase superfamily)